MPPLILDFIPSRILNAALAFFHLLAFISILICPLPQLAETLLSGIVTVSFIWHGYHSLYRRSSRFIRCLLNKADGGWRLITGDGKQHDVELLDFYWHPYLLVLNFSAEGWSKHTVIILPDNAPAGAVRRLRVRLQLQRSEATAG